VQYVIGPQTIRPQVEAYQGFLTSGGIDANNPDSKLTTNFPAAIQSAVAEITSYIAANC
jgi:hypothetical protein